MPDPKTQAWDFGGGPPKDQADLPRDDLLKKTREATASVGYVPQNDPPTNQEKPSSRKSASGSKTKTQKRGRPRKSRSVALSTKIAPEHDDLLKAISAEGFVIADIVEEALTVFSRELIRSRKYKRFPLDQVAIEKASAAATLSK